jgi:hypothetical protein
MKSKFLQMTIVLVAATLAGTEIGCFNPVERATKNIQQGAESLSKGMTDLSNIDPIALNKLLKANDELRKTAEQLRSKLQEVDGVGTMYVGPGSEVSFEITGYKGRLRISGWVDQDRNKFMDNRVLELLENPFVLDKSWAQVSAEYSYASWQEKNAAMAKVAQDSFNKYLANPFVPPSVDMRVHAIDRRFLTSGQHSVMLQITPEALDKYGQWEIEYKMYVTTANKQDLVTVGRMDSQTSKFDLGKPMLPKEVAFANVVIAPLKP